MGIPVKRSADEVGVKRRLRTTSVPIADDGEGDELTRMRSVLSGDCEQQAISDRDCR